MLQQVDTQSIILMNSRGRFAGNFVTMRQLFLIVPSFQPYHLTGCCGNFQACRALECSENGFAEANSKAKQRVLA